jgi:hypothetical protein
MGGVFVLICQNTFTANNVGAKKSGVLLCGNFENMGGVYAAGIMPFVFAGKAGRED